MYYKVTITKTAKSIGSKEDFHTFDNDVKTFETKDLALRWIDAEYKGHKKIKMYCEKKDGSTEHIGWIYCFVNADLSHSPVEKWTDQDWVDITEVTEKRVTF